MKKNKIIISVLFVTFLLCVCGCNSVIEELSADSVYNLLGFSRAAVHNKLGLRKNDYQYKYSDEEDPFHQYEIIDKEKVIEGKTGTMMLHFDNHDVLNQVMFNFPIDGEQDAAEYWLWGCSVAKKLDEKWKDANGPLGAVFNPEKSPDYSSNGMRIRRWVISEDESYSFSWGVDLSGQDNSWCGTIFSN